VSLTPAPNPATWFAGVEVNDGLIKTNLTDPLNATIAQVNGITGGTFGDTILNGNIAVTGTFNFPTPYPSGVTPIVVASYYAATTGAYGVQITARSNTGFSYRFYTTSGSSVPANETMSAGYIAIAP
jgi:hypothetical protein